MMRIKSRLFFVNIDSYFIMLKNEVYIQNQTVLYPSSLSFVFKLANTMSGASSALTLTTNFSFFCSFFTTGTDSLLKTFSLFFMV